MFVLFHIQNFYYIYSAAGEKLATNANGSLTYYRSVMVYGNDNKLLYILTTEGTVTRTEGSAGTSYTYNYFKKDQIGSTRAVLSAVGNTLQNVQSTDYYPFGLAYSTNNLNKNKYLFSGKELQDVQVVVMRILQMQQTFCAVLPLGRMNLRSAFIRQVHQFTWNL